MHLREQEFLRDQGASMPNQDNSRHAALLQFSSPAMLDRVYAGRASTARPPEVNARLRQQRVVAPDAIWGQYNNYRSNGLVGSAIIHVVMLALILGGALFGHKVVQRVEQHETVTLIAPSPDSYALPVAKKVISGGGGGGDHDRYRRRKADCRSLRCSKSLLRRSSCAMNIPSLQLSRRWWFHRKFGWHRTIC